MRGGPVTRLPAAERRRQLLDSATAVFATAGLHTASMNDVATAAGVTKPVLYQHFASKRELYLALLRDVGDQLRDAVAKAVIGASGPRQQVDDGFAAFFGWVGDNTDGFTVLFAGETRRDPEFARELERVERDMAEVIADLIVVPGLAAERRDLLAYGIVGIAETTARHWLATGNAVGADMLAGQVAALAWAGLRGQRPA
jgi:AcrR family transcriptional regulator